MTEPRTSGQRRAVGGLVSGKSLCFAVLMLGCFSRIARQPPSAPPVEPRVSALLDVTTDKEAIVVAVIKSAVWQTAASAGATALKRLARGGTTYQVFPPVSEEGGRQSNGELSGGFREDCGDYFFALGAPQAARGFAVVSTAGAGAPLRSVQLQSTNVEPAYAAAVAGIITRTTKLKVSPTIEHAYRVDLDGNGRPEVVLQATHPDLNGDPLRYKPEYYSLIVVLPDEENATPVFAGYLQAAKGLADFEVLTLDSVADVDLDGKQELLVRARHAEGWQTQIFRYDGKLRELFHSVGGEGECPGSSQ